MLSLRVKDAGSIVSPVAYAKIVSHIPQMKKFLTVKRGVRTVSFADAVNASKVGITMVMSFPLILKRAEDTM